MKTTIPAFKKFIPYIVAVFSFILISMIYFNPLLSGKKIKQGDIRQHKGMAKEIVDFRESDGEEALWTNSMFGGMPAYQISILYPSNLFKKVDNLLKLGLPRPADMLFLNMLGFFFLLVVMGVNPWLSIIGAFAYGFSSYFFIILEAGHNSKAHAMAYMAPVLASVFLTYKGKRLLGAALTMFFVALQVSTNHLQITYYLIIMLFIVGIAELIHHIRTNQLPQFLKASALLIAGGLIAVGPNITNVLLTSEYAKHTIRGKSELTENKKNQTSGLDKDYITQWSYGKEETFTLMIPNAKGGGSGYIGNSKHLDNADAQFKAAVSQQNQYWGNQPFTSGPVYVGSIIIFLFILGLFIVKSHWKWALVIATLLSIFLSWGHNMMWFTNIFLDYVPGYNKFRTVSMTLVIAELSIPLLAFLALKKIFSEPEIITQKATAFYISLGLTVGVALIFYLIPQTFFHFTSEMEASAFEKQVQSNPQYADQIALFLSSLKSVRIGIFKADVLRSIVFILLSAATLFLYAKKLLKKPVILIILFALIAVDMWTIDKRYLNDENFESKRLVENPFKPSAADQQIMKDKSLGYRVFNTTVSPFNDASTSYFHHSIGGYHGAKLRRYNELIDRYISKQNAAVLNMLNTKYFIVSGENRQPVAQINPEALGAAWFVNNIDVVDNADKEIAALNNFDPSKTAIVDKRFQQQISTQQFNIPENSSIELINYKPNRLVYQSNNTEKGLAVFSEIYYPLGWNAYIDGKPATYFRSNYVLRAMEIPAGKHEITFEFKPKNYFLGENIALGSSILILLLFAGSIWWEVKRNWKIKDEK